jgi:hypothetical protein
VANRDRETPQPSDNQAFALERTQMYEEAFLQLLIAVRV